MSTAALKRQLVEAGHAVVRAVVRETLTGLLGTDVTMAQFKALVVIDKQSGCTSGALSGQLGVKPPAASLLVAKLVGAGLAFGLRAGSAARRATVRPTLKGANLGGRVRHGGEAVLEGWVEHLSSADLVAAARGMEALAAVASKASGTPAVATR